METDDLPPLVLESMPTPSNTQLNESDFEDEDASDEEMENSFEETTKCLFCLKNFSSAEVAMQHIESTHDLSFPKLRRKFQMDQYSFIKLINFIRKEKPNAKKIIEADHVLWDDEKYLKPLEYEPWLTYDYEMFDPNDDANLEKDGATGIEFLKQQLQEKTRLLEKAHEDIKKMRIGFQRLFNEKDDTNMKPLNCVSATSLKCDDGYFSSYAHFGIHHEMLSDIVRTTSYRDALLKNCDFVHGKDVLDVGCGTSVLSIFASQAGAKNVIGIDNSEIVYNAMDIVKNNNITNVQVIKGRLEDTHLPQEKYDIIISEWMGYFLLFEGMLDSIIYARDTHLKEGGVLMPSRCTMSIVGYGSNTLYEDHVTFWNDVYGLNMSNMRKEAMHEPLIEVVDPKYILTKSNVIADLDMSKVDINYSNFTYDLKMECTENGMLSALVGYFDTFFELPVQISFSTSPYDKPTHWKQVVFFLNEPKEILKGDIILGKLKCRRSKNSARSLDISIEIFGQLHTYYLD